MSINKLLKLANYFENKIIKQAQLSAEEAKKQQEKAVKEQQKVPGIYYTGDALVGKVEEAPGYDVSKPGGDFKVDFKGDAITLQDLSDRAFNPFVKEMQAKLIELALNSKGLESKLEISKSDRLRLLLAPYGADGLYGDNTVFAVSVADRIAAKVGDPFGMDSKRTEVAVKANIDTLKAVNKKVSMMRGFEVKQNKMPSEKPSLPKDNDLWVRQGPGSVDFSPKPITVAPGYTDYNIGGERQVDFTHSQIAGKTPWENLMAKK